jgi:hypothetical protein
MLSRSQGGAVAVAAAAAAAAAAAPRTVGLSNTASCSNPPAARVVKYRIARGQLLVAKQSRSFRLASEPGLPLPQGLLAIPDGAKGLIGWTVAAKKVHKQHATIGSVQQVRTLVAAAAGFPARAAHWKLFTSC